MKRNGIALLLVLLSGIVPAIDLTTFHPGFAHHSLLSWQLDGGANAGWRAESTHREASRRLAAGGSVNWQTRTLSDDIDWELTIPAGAGFRNSDRQTTGQESGCESYSRSAWVDFDPGLGARFYQPGTDLYLSGGAYGDCGWDRDAELKDFHCQRTRRWLHLRGIAGVGYGRVRDAWPLLKAVRLSDILRDEDVLDRALTDGELHDLAGFISRSWRLFLAHERPARHYYDSLELHLRRAGVLGEPLPARALMRLDENLYAGSYERPFGWRAWTRIEGRSSLDYEHSIFEDTTETSSTGADFLLEAGAEYARPVGLDWLFTGTISYRLREDIVEYRDWTRHPYEFGLGATVSWQALDRLSVDVNVDARPVYYLTRYLDRYHIPPTHYLEVPCSLGAGLSYYAAERLRVVTSVRCSGYREFYQDRHGFEQSGKAIWTLDFKLNFGRLPYGWGVRYIA